MSYHRIITGIHFALMLRVCLLLSGLLLVLVNGNRMVRVGFEYEMGLLHDSSLDMLEMVVFYTMMTKIG